MKVGVKRTSQKIDAREWFKNEFNDICGEGCWCWPSIGPTVNRTPCIFHEFDDECVDEQNCLLKRKLRDYYLIEK